MNSKKEFLVRFDIVQEFHYGDTSIVGDQVQALLHVCMQQQKEIDELKRLVKELGPTEMVM
jgi:hypothetical protein